MIISLDLANLIPENLFHGNHSKEGSKKPIFMALLRVTPLTKLTNRNFLMLINEF